MRQVSIRGGTRWRTDGEVGRAVLGSHLACDEVPTARRFQPSLWQPRRDGEGRLAMRHGRVEQYGAPAVAHGLRTVPVPLYSDLSVELLQKTGLGRDIEVC